MKQTELMEAIRTKTAELEVAQQTGRPQEEIAALYKELKDLQYQKVQADLEQAGKPE